MNDIKTGYSRCSGKTTEDIALEMGWKKIEGAIGVKDNLCATNPQFSTGLYEWTYNCQRCVPCYEMRRRGYDVEVCPRREYDDYMSAHPFCVWQNPDIICCRGNTIEDIDQYMATWGDGARAQIVVTWYPSTIDGHTFVAERVDGQTYFYDPQSGDMDVSEWFKDGSIYPGTMKICRIDNLEPSDYVKSCCKGRIRI